MQYVCDAPKGKTWFRIETEGEAAHESRLMSHTVENISAASGRRQSSPGVRSAQRDRARHRPRGPCTARDAAFPHVARQGGQCTGYSDAATGGKDRGGFRIIIVAASNADPYPEQDAAIAALGAHFGLTLDRHRCFPYGR